MDEDRAEIVLEASEINDTLNSPGWKDIIKPALESRMKALVGEFCNAVGYENLVRIQQSINAINGLMDFIENKLLEGRTVLDEADDKSEATSLRE
ncbi:hypothetical protein LCGC14_1009690 [marine sediment metagenome]|uniref:Uncharacterized protein n=1 Tax=marine sediment metagenome TaxID=412755 RepID=A0A0F9QIX4_9ZZZZ